MKVVVGLGNPGPEYEGTRHNLGFEVVGRVARRLRVKLKAGRGPALQARTRRGGDEVLLLCPLTYMNLSGEALSRLDPARSWPLSRILVVCDDLALPAGSVRLRRQGSDGGHNGLASIEEALGSRSYPRLRLGVGAPPAGKDGADYVTERPTAAEQEAIGKAVAEATWGVLTWLDSTPIERVMSQLNRRSDPDPPDPPTGE